MMYQCTNSHCLRTNQVIGRNVSLQVLLPEAVCCCGFDIRVVLHTSVLVRNANTSKL